MPGMLHLSIYTPNGTGLRLASVWFWSSRVGLARESGENAKVMRVAMRMIDMKGRWYMFWKVYKNGK